MIEKYVWWNCDRIFVRRVLPVYTISTHGLLSADKTTERADSSLPRGRKTCRKLRSNRDARLEPTTSDLALIVVAPKR